MVVESSFFVERERIAFQRYVARVRDEMSHDVALSYFVYAAFFYRIYTILWKSLEIGKVHVWDDQIWQTVF